MKNTRKILQKLTIAGAILAGTISATNADEISVPANPANPVPANSEQKMLVTFYSWGGNTRDVAQHIAKQTGADIFEIEPVTPYPTVYRECTRQAKRDIEKKAFPQLKKQPNLRDYDLIFVGSPNWWGTVATPISTLLKNPDFADKTVAPFFTHGGGGMQNCAKDLKSQISGNARILEAFTTYGGGRSAKKDADAWLEKLELKKK